LNLNHLNILIFWAALAFSVNKCTLFLSIYSVYPANSPPMLGKKYSVCYLVADMAERDLHIASDF